MNWKSEYDKKVCTAEEAVSVIQDNWNLVYGHAICCPIVLNKALVKIGTKFSNLNIFHLIYSGDPLHISSEMQGHIKVRSSFYSGEYRKLADQGRVSFVSCNFHQVGDYFINGIYPVDAILLQVSKPDEQGYCSLGATCDYTFTAVENARIVIAEVNEKMPYTYGNNRVHVSKINHIVETSEQLPIFGIPLTNETDERIANYCTSMIEDESTLQIGIGGIPHLVALKLKDRKNLGIHTELFSDCLIELYESGAITNNKKKLHEGKIITTFSMGTQAVYDFIDKNPEIEFHPVSYVNNPFIIGQNHKLVSINSCIEIDLTGQVVSESIGYRQFSGPGGQLDFVRGSQYSKGGLSIITVSSVTKNNKSKIVSTLTPGGIVTTPRSEVDYIISEYGIARLKGKTIEERAKALIDIAHPDHRDTLAKEFEENFVYKL